jgi:peroxiredoxin (alkyl hydroperoxide reductase subunit C)
LINPEGMIKLAEINDNGIGRNADELIRKVQAAQFIAAHPNEVCPAKWTPGDKTLKPGLDLVGKI